MLRLKRGNTNRIFSIINTKATFSMAVLLTFCSTSAQANLKELIDARKGSPAVIVPVDSGTNSNSDSGYTVRGITPQDFAEQMELADPAKLENPYFTIVENDGSIPLPSTDFDGDNVLYHLMIARNYYAKLAQKSGFGDEALNHQLIVRVRVNRQYNLVTHFAKQSDYDNSRYIPAEPQLVSDYNQTQHLTHPESPLVNPWNQEIWFDQRKALDSIDLYNLISGMGVAVAEQQWIALSSTPLQIFQNYNAGIDGAKIPDVIYHETFHYATDAEGLFPMASEGNPVAEDYANYFGSSINGLPKIAEIEEFSGRDYKHKYDQIKEITDTQPSDYNSTSFGPSVFWQIRKWIGQERADQLIWNSLHYLKNGSFLHVDVPIAVSAAAHADSDLNGDEIAEIDSLFSKYQKSYENLEIKFNPGETQIIHDQDLTDAAEKEADKLQKIPEQLHEQGVELSQSTIDRIYDSANLLRSESKKVGFRAKVVRALNRVAHAVKIAGADTAKATGYIGTAVLGATVAPIDFGTDFATGLFRDTGMLSQGDRSHAIELTGTVGAIGTAYSTYAGLSALGFTLLNPISVSALGVVMVDGIVCDKANLKGSTSVDRYCAENAIITQDIDGNSAIVGAKAGKSIHEEFARIFHFFKEHLEGKNSQHSDSQD